MPSEVTLNDALLQPFLLAQDSAESQQQLMILLSDHAEPKIRGIIYSRIRSHFGDEYLPDLEDLYSEAKTKLVGYLIDLKSNLTASPCEDFRGYVATIARNVCNDYLRQTYPVRARLYKKIRDMLHSHPKLAMWKPEGDSSGDWVCGFNHWRGQSSSSRSLPLLHQFYENPTNITEALAAGADIQAMPLDDLLASTFKHIGGPIKVADAVSLVSDVKGIKDRPVASFDNDEFGVRQSPPDSSLLIDSVMEMREPLTLFWRGLCELPRDEFKAYLLYARDAAREDLITLFLDAEITSEREIAGLLEMTIAQFRDLCVNRLPMDNESIAQELGVKIERVYKLRCNAGKRLKKLRSSMNTKKLVPHR